jgi:uncharacterized protein
LKIQIDNIPEEGILLWSKEAAETYPVLAEMVASGECRFEGPIHVSLRARPVREMIEAEGQIETNVRLPCRRCLEPFDCNLKRRFRLFFTREMPEFDDADGEEGAELSADDVGLTLFRGDAIDFTDVIQEQAVLALPNWALCSENCRGLCPRCGANLNQAACGCETDVADDRFAVLKNLRIE